MAMQTIFRTPQVEQYTVLSNAILNPSISGLSLRASALLISLLSKPKDWIVNPEYMAASGVESLYIIRQTLRELREFGYVIFKRLSSGCTDWFVYDSPQNSKENIHSTPIKSTAEQPVKPSTKTAEIASIPPVVEIEAEMRDFMIDKKTGKVVEGDKKLGDVITIWSFVWQNGHWVLNLIETDDMSMEYLTEKSKVYATDGIAV